LIEIKEHDLQTCSSNNSGLTLKAAELAAFLFAQKGMSDTFCPLVVVRGPPQSAAPPVDRTKKKKSN
jgi:hypothetical protein